MEKLTKQQLKSYLKDRWDVQHASIVSELKIEQEDLDVLNTFLSELEEEGFVTKSRCTTHQCDEYDPGPSQGGA
jgi:pyrroloquinoline quinone (PQQ) biosynthesis protein C